LAYNTDKGWPGEEHKPSLGGIKKVEPDSFTFQEGHEILLSFLDNFDKVAVMKAK
jgi:hypothetical protein